MLAKLAEELAGKLWIATCEANELERATIQLYRQHLDLHIAPLLGVKKLNELTVPALRAFQDQLRDSGRSLAPPGEAWARRTRTASSSESCILSSPTAMGRSSFCRIYAGATGTRANRGGRCRAGARPSGQWVMAVDDDGKQVAVMAAKYSGLHALRHFFCSWCAARPQDRGLGLPLKMVQVRMGHSTLAMTADRYGHLFPSQDDAEVLAAGEEALMRA